MLHAWNLDADGFVLDRTWNPHGRIYLGIIFPLVMIPIKRDKHLISLSPLFRSHKVVPVNKPE